MQNNDWRDRSSYGSHDNNWHDSYRNQNRDWSDRAGDEVRSRMGNEEAEHRRRRMDEMRDNRNDWERNRTQNTRRDYNRPASHYGNRMGTYDRPDSGRSMYSVPGLEPGDPRWGMADYNDSGITRGNERYGWEYNQRHHTDRNLADQLADEFRSWFGNKEAARRREMDARDIMPVAMQRGGNWDYDRDRTHYRDSDYSGNWVENHNRMTGRTDQNRDYDLW